MIDQSVEYSINRCVKSNDALIVAFYSIVIKAITLTALLTKPPISTHLGTPETNQSDVRGQLFINLCKYK